MRKFIDIVKCALNEGEVVDLKARKFGKAVDDYTSAVQNIVASEKDLFSTGKFTPFAKTYIDSGFAARFNPATVLDVSLRDERPSPQARAVLARLRAERFSLEPAVRRAKGSPRVLNTEQNACGAFGRKRIEIAEARSVFAARGHSPYGAYRPSQYGFRTAPLGRWDERGVGFSIIVGGHDSRRGDKHGDPTQEEHHIVDNDDDMTEVAHMCALIARARMAES